MPNTITSNTLKPPLDVLIITAVRDEYEAVLKVDTGAWPSSSWVKEAGPANHEIAFRDFQFSDKSRMRVAVAYATEMGQVASTEVAVSIVSAYKIRCLAMCGVCAGRRGKVNLGDVIVADRLWVYDTGKLKAEYDEQGNRHEHILGDPTTYNLDSKWNQNAEIWQPDPKAPWLSARPYSYDAQELWVLERVLLGDDPVNHPDSATRCPAWDTVLDRLLQTTGPGGEIEGELSFENNTLTLTQRGRDRINR